MRMCNLKDREGIEKISSGGIGANTRKWESACLTAEISSDSLPLDEHAALERLREGSDSDDAGRNETLEEIHEAFAMTILGLAIAHVAAAVFESIRHRENLIKAMITGRKRKPTGTDVEYATDSHRG